MSDNRIAEVTQADRDAAANHMKGVWTLNGLAEKVRSGEKDDNVTVQAFARHRTAASQAPDAGEDIQLAIAKAIHGPDFDPFQSPEAFDACESIAAAALATLTAPPTSDAGERMKFSPEAVAAATADVARLQHELDVTNADHVALWLEANTIPDEPMSQCISWLACRIVESHEAAIGRARNHNAVAIADAIIPDKGDGETTAIQRQAYWHVAHKAAEMALSPPTSDAGTREKIVAWLRSIDEGPLKGWQPNALASAIERGDYFRLADESLAIDQPQTMGQEFDATSDAGEEAVEAVAQWLHDEGGFADACPTRTWPEHPDDTGRREGGFVRLVPKDVQAQFRDVARRLLTQSAAAALSPPTSGEEMRLREALPRLDDGLIEAAMLAHYGKWASNLGINGVDLTANDANWTFRDGFKRMWAGVRKELNRRAALAGEA